MLTLYVCALLLFVVNSAQVALRLLSDLLMAYREQSAAGCIGLLDWCTNLPQMAVDAPACRCWRTEWWSIMSSADLSGHHPVPH